MHDSKLMNIPIARTDLKESKSKAYWSHLNLDGCTGSNVKSFEEKCAFTRARSSLAVTSLPLATSDGCGT